MVSTMLWLFGVGIFSSSSASDRAGGEVGVIGGFVGALFPGGVFPLIGEGGTISDICKSLGEVSGEGLSVFSFLFLLCSCRGGCRGGGWLRALGAGGGRCR